MRTFQNASYRAPRRIQSSALWRTRSADARTCWPPTPHRRRVSRTFGRRGPSFCPSSFFQPPGHTTADTWTSRPSRGSASSLLGPSISPETASAERYSPESRSRFTTAACAQRCSNRRVRRRTAPASHSITHAMKPSAKSSSLRTHCVPPCPPTVHLQRSPRRRKRHSKRPSRLTATASAHHRCHRG